MNLKKYFLLIIIIILLISSCKIFTPEKSVKLTEDLKLDNTALFIDGCKEKIIGNYEKASSNFLSCIKTDPSNSAAFYELADVYNMQKKNKEALIFIEKAIKIDPVNEWYQKLYAEILTASNKFKEAVTVYEKLAKNHADNIEYYYDWAMACLYSEKYSDAIEVYNIIEQKTGISEDISLQKEKIYINLNNFNKAVDELLKLITEFPSETKYYSYLADLYMAKNKTNEAYELYQKILKIDPDDGNVHLSLAELYRIKGEKEKSFSELKLAFSNINLDIDTKIKILLSYYTLTENSNLLKEQAYTLINLMISANYSDAKAYSIYGDFLYRDKKLKEAKDQYLKVISLDSSRYVIWEQLLFIEADLNDNKALENESKRAISLFPEQATLYLFNGAANYVLKNYTDAISSLNTGISLVVYNDDLLKRFYTYLGDSYHAIKNTKDAFINYEKVIKIDPENDYVLNNYSYYLSLLGVDLDKAEKMSKKAVDINPTNSNYLDTYGWILYKEEKYSDAQIFIEKAIKNGGDSNSVIVEHLGDILFKLGQPAKALENWIKAKEIGTGSDFLEKKINDKTLYE
ncbi:MAG: tetratricopeptide repeat protein [Bacteroidetes bacterium]|nr:tetratricopeptide repeat protein [Bacteroidota bacterium]